MIFVWTMGTTLFPEEVYCQKQHNKNHPRDAGAWNIEVESRKKAVRYQHGICYTHYLNQEQMFTLFAEWPINVAIEVL